MQVYFVVVKIKLKLIGVFYQIVQLLSFNNVKKTTKLVVLNYTSFNNLIHNK